MKILGNFAAMAGGAMSAYLWDSGMHKAAGVFLVITIGLIVENRTEVNK